MRAAVSRLHQWYAKEARDLPWRRTRDPYAIWVSEAMLQQTQVATVIAYYERWIARFPDVCSLAAADEAEVLLHWEGLGYYRRARLLHRAAKEVCEHHGGKVPEELEALRALSGVGEYTAAAIASIAFDVDAPVLDGNVQRVLARLIRLEHAPQRAVGKRMLAELAAELLPQGTACTHNQAMMELGARICTPRKPRCELCPLRSACIAHEAGEMEAYPRKLPKKQVPHRHLAVAVLKDDAGRLLLYKRPYDGMLAGLWDFPTIEVDGPLDDAKSLVRTLRERYGLRATKVRQVPEVQHAYTHFKVTLHPWILRLAGGRGMLAADGEDSVRWVGQQALARHALPRASHKVLESIGRLATDGE